MEERIMNNLNFRTEVASTNYVLVEFTRSRRLD